ncbi:MAG: Rieske 2Fe-2S domain-containing protein, partial [Polyangiaceae bacterium]
PIDPMQPVPEPETHVPGRRSMPPPAPSGWYVVALSSELAPGARLTRPFFGGEVVVYRTASGRVVATRPFCPHLGAHLGHSGRVEGETLRCSFHGFRFDAEGTCVEAYPQRRVPPACRLPLLPARERNGHVLVYHHPRGVAPTWEVPAIDDSGYRAPIYQTWDLAGHPQETSENSVDIGHLASVHGYQQVAAPEPMVADGPVLRGKYSMHRRSRWSDVTTEFAVQVWGLGYSVVDVHVVGHDVRTRQFVLATPTDEGRISLRIGLALQRVGSKSALHPLAALAPRFVLEALIERAAFLAFRHDVSQDFSIWQAKTYLPRPALADGDGPVGLYRKWTRQFYEDPPLR